MCFLSILKDSTQFFASGEVCLIEQVPEVGCTDFLHGSFPRNVRRILNHVIYGFGGIPQV